MDVTWLTCLCAPSCTHRRHHQFIIALQHIKPLFPLKVLPTTLWEATTNWSNAGAGDKVVPVLRVQKILKNKIKKEVSRGKWTRSLRSQMPSYSFYHTFNFITFQLPNSKTEILVPRRYLGFLKSQNQIIVFLIYFILICKIKVMMASNMQNCRVNKVIYVQFLE